MGFFPASANQSVAGNLAVAGAVSSPSVNGVPWLPSDNAEVAAVDLLAYATANSVVMIAGTLYLCKLYIRQAATITNILLGMNTAGSGASTGSFVGLYNSAGTLLSGSADQATQFTTAGPTMVTCPLSTPQAVAAGSFVWAALLTNLATTQPTLLRVGGAGVLAYLNSGLAAAGFRFAANGTGLTSLPGSITPASNTTTGALSFWAGTS